MTTESNPTLTEYLAADETDDSIDGPAAVNYRHYGGRWRVDSGTVLDSDPDEYRAECSCGETFGSWGKAIRHARDEH